MEHFSKFRHSKTSVSHMFINQLYEIIGSPFKSLVATTTGFITSFIPAAVTEVTGRHITTAESILQILVLIVTLIIGVTSLITWWQKQIDRRKKIKQESDEQFKIKHY